jgi:hypothetical protein
MAFSPVGTLEELDALDGAQIIEGYLAAERGDSEPGENRGKAFWHGWRNRMIDMGELPPCQHARALAGLLVARDRQHRFQEQD